MTHPRVVSALGCGIFRDHLTSIGPVKITHAWSDICIRAAGLSWSSVTEVDALLSRSVHLISTGEFREVAQMLTRHFRGIPNDKALAVVSDWWLARKGMAHCHEVIEEDAYGLRALYVQGFRPLTIVDVGGGIGTFTLLALTLWPRAIVYCFEPQPDMLGILEANLAARSNVVIERMALIGFAGQPRAEGEYTNVPGYPEMVSKAPTCSVTQFLTRRTPPPIDLLKTDCEGGEIGILRELSECGRLAEISEVRGEWHFDYAREQIPLILGPSHSVDIKWDGASRWDLFSATRRPAVEETR